MGSGTDRPAWQREGRRLSVVYSLLYVSRSLVAPDGASPPAAVRAIVNYSTDYNSRNGITGALIWTPRHFAQVLEGDMAAVHLLYNRILRDTRHEQVELVDTRDVQARAFADWSLAYSGGTSYVQERLARLNAAGAETADEQEIATLLGLIRELVGTGGISHEVRPP